MSEGERNLPARRRNATERDAAERERERVVSFCIARFFFFALCFSSYNWLESPNLMKLNHLQKIYYAYKALTRAAVTKSRGKQT